VKDPQPYGAENWDGVLLDAYIGGRRKEGERERDCGLTAKLAMDWTAGASACLIGVMYFLYTCSAHGLWPTGAKATALTVRREGVASPAAKDTSEVGTEVT